MPTIMTHAVVGLGLGKVYTGRKMPPLFWVLTAMLPMVPDVDVLAFRLGIPYGAAFGHRGFTHSLSFALFLAALAGALTYKPLAVRRWDLVGFLFVAVASHGLLDALTNGGSGVAFFWPFDSARYFFPWTPIEVSPIGLNFFGPRGLRVLHSEMLWVWLPTAAVVGVVVAVRKWQETRRRQGTE
jgi:inner membrane protein